MYVTLVPCRAVSLCGRLQLIKEQECHEGTDAEFDTLILDEDKFCDALEPIMEEGGVVGGTFFTFVVDTYLNNVPLDLM